MVVLILLLLSLKAGRVFHQCERLIRADIDCDLWHQVCVGNVIYTGASKVGRRLDMLRREFVAGAATSALLARPLRARAQQSATRRMRIGILIYSTPQRDPNTQTLLEGFRQIGYVDGQNVTIEYRYAQG